MPVTVKIRKGWDDDSINAVEVAKIIEQGGAAALRYTAGREQNFTAERRIGI